MQLLKFTVRDQVIHYSPCARVVVAESRGHVFASFDLDEEWAGLDVTAIFENDRISELFPVQLNANPVEVPAKVLVPGVLRVSLEGITKGDNLFAPSKNSTRLTTMQMNPPVRVHRA